jgi:hypothetical protein
VFGNIETYPSFLFVQPLAAQIKKGKIIEQAFTKHLINQIKNGSL